MPCRRQRTAQRTWPWWRSGRGSRAGKQQRHTQQLLRPTPPGHAPGHTPRAYRLHGVATAATSASPVIHHRERGTSGRRFCPTAPLSVHSTHADHGVWSGDSGVGVVERWKRDRVVLCGRFKVVVGMVARRAWIPLGIHRFRPHYLTLPTIYLYHYTTPTLIDTPTVWSTTDMTV